ncbi:MAG: DUF3822 family protein, partial [Rikenellaceae bacterium]
MQEVGKIRTTCGKILSIQSQLGGLSFYCGADKKQYHISVDNTAEAAVVIAREIAADSYDHIDYFHNSLDYILIPRSLFDENMCDAYLLTKGIQQKTGDVIRVTLTADVAYISLVSGEINAVTTCCNVFPVIAKCYKYCSTIDGRRIAYVLEDGLLHVCYSDSLQVLFCESLPLTSASDFEFFLGEIVRRYDLRGDYFIDQLFSSDSYKVPFGGTSIDKIGK